MDNFQSKNLPINGNTSKKGVTHHKDGVVSVIPTDIQSKEVSELMQMVNANTSARLEDLVERGSYPAEESKVVSPVQVESLQEKILASPSPSKLGFGIGKQVVTSELPTLEEQSKCVKFGVPNLIPGPCEGVDFTKDLYFGKQGLVCNNVRLQGFNEWTHEQCMEDFPIEQIAPERDGRDLLHFSLVIEPVLNWYQLWYKFILFLLSKIRPMISIIELLTLFIYFLLDSFDIEKVILMTIVLLVEILIIEIAVKPFSDYNWLKEWFDWIILTILEIRDRKGIGLTRKQRRENFLDSVNDLYIEVSSFNTVFTDAQILQRDTESSLLPYVQANLPLTKYKIKYNNGFGVRHVNILCCTPIVQWVVGEYKTRDSFKANAYRAILLRVKRFSLAAEYYAEVVKGTYTIANYYHIKSTNVHDSISPLN